MKTAIRHKSAVAMLALLLSSAHPKVFAQGEGNSTVNCDAGGANLQTKLDNASSGATVWVTGTCARGPYTISKNISLTGFGTDGATLSAPNGTHVLIVQGAILRLQDVRINGGAGSGILVHGGQLFANRIVVEGAADHGVRLGVHSHGTITNSTFRNNLFGIETAESSGAFLQGNTLEANRIAGLSVVRSSSAIVDGNTIKDNTVAGVVVDSNGSITLKNNSVTGNLSVGVLARRNGFLNTVTPANAFASNGTDVQCFERAIIDASDGPQQPGGGTVDADTSCLIIGTMF
ncbi:MAG TPA: right-handed parallel beta-helix repeat-containing protein [Vicinamibacterales bacterium]|nr:right-handed parallel beta-helix repeat-containing protein [Vicinamibacterales bacterium]